MIAPLSVVLPALTVLWGLRGASGYLTIAALVLLENFGIPVPGETALIAGAAYAGHGHLNIVAVAVVAFIAAVIGDNIGYAIGRSAGRRLVTRYGRYLLLPPARFARAEQFVTRHGPEIIIAARFIEGLRQLNGIIAGTPPCPGVASLPTTFSAPPFGSPYGQPSATTPATTWPPSKRTCASISGTPSRHSPCSPVPTPASISFADDEMRTTNLRGPEDKPQRRSAAPPDNRLTSDQHY